MTSVNRPGPKGPHGKPHVRTGTVRQKVWRAIQIKGKFSLTELCRAVLTGDETAKAPRSNINRYVTALCKVGVLAEMKHRAAPTTPTSNGEKRWLLVRDLGRQAPVVRMSGAVFDPNAGREVAHG